MTKCTGKTRWDGIRGNLYKLSANHKPIKIKAVTVNKKNTYMFLSLASKNQLLLIKSREKELKLNSVL